MKALNLLEYHRIFSSFKEEQNQLLAAEFETLKNSSEVTKTHYIDQRFENIYVEREQVSGLSDLLEEAISHASEILGIKKRIKVGFWFNEMQQGHKTSAHTHDEDDELLSAVYYINVPENSGDLILGDEFSKNGTENELITPKAGEFVFFSPKLIHSVTENKSTETRLSIGMNFGPEDN